MKIFISFFFFLFMGSLIYSQNNIINTLGTNGVFSIKDASNNYLTVTQSTGEVNILNGLRLEVTENSSTTGVIFKGGNRFIHDFTPTGASRSNTFVGENSGNFTMSFTGGTDASFNTAVGYISLSSLTTGSYNTALGSATLINNAGGSENTALGSASLFNNNSGSENTAIGNSSLSSNGVGFQNTAVGNLSLLKNNGNYNTALGYNAGSTVTTGANLTLLGIDANPSSPTAIDQITLGNIFVTSLRCNVQNISSLSDARDKKNIKELNLGIDFLMKIKSRLFNWDKREWYDDNKSDGSKMKEEPTAGFIAQELDEVQITENAEWLNLVLKDNPEKLEATPGNLLPIIVKAIQELKGEKDNEIAELYERIKGLENELIEIKSNNNLVQISNNN
ncbi:MAG: tail fiber domain-containing protein [Ignavibacteria bacterium]|nr:tail fiber domain-containing protein [Ignavibacteria bacterium]